MSAAKPAASARIGERGRVRHLPHGEADAERRAPAAVGQAHAFDRLADADAGERHRLVPGLRVLEARAAGGKIERRERAHLDRMGVGLGDLAGRVGRDAARLGLLDDLGAHGGVEGADHARDRRLVERLEALELERSRLRAGAAGRY